MHWSLLKFLVENIIYNFYYCVKHNYSIINLITDLNSYLYLLCVELCIFLYIQFLIEIFKFKKKDKNEPLTWFKIKYIKISYGKCETFMTQ